VNIARKKFVGFAIASVALATPAALLIGAGTAQADEQTVNCGSGPNGLAIVAITTRGSAACDTANAVINQFMQASQPVNGAVAVQVGDTQWVCQRHPGPGPYQECVSQQNPLEKVRLQS
jgi:hypothetical protein